MLLFLYISSLSRREYNQYITVELDIHMYQISLSVTLEINFYRTHKYVPVLSATYTFFKSQPTESGSWIT